MSHSDWTYVLGWLTGALTMWVWWMRRTVPR